MNQKTITWGIVGCGDVCEIKSGPAFNKVDHSKLLGVMRRNPIRAKDFARRHDVPMYFTDASELINHPDINAIYIATPPSTHEEYTEQTLKAGKPVYVEKPITTSSASCERMIELSKKYNNKVSVAHYRRELPLFKKVKSLVNDGVLGTVRYIDIKVLQPPVSPIITQTPDNWRVKPEVSGGGLFFDLSPHQLDIMYWIFGVPEKMSGQSFNISRSYNAPDVSFFQALFNSGPSLNGSWVFNVTASAIEDKCEIIGDNGKIVFSFFKKSTIEIITEDGTEILQPEYPENIQLHMIAAVTKYFRGERGNPCSLEEALIVMKMMESAAL